MLYNIYSDLRTNTGILDKIGMAQGNVKPISPKQKKWLEIAQQNYNVTIENIDDLTKSEASLKITNISMAIASGRVTPRKAEDVQEIYYAVIKVEADVRIKSFIGTYEIASAKIQKNYHPSVVKLVTKDIDKAKNYAKALTEPVVEQEIATTTEGNDNAEILAILHSLDEVQLKEVAKTNAINLSRVTKKETMIKKIYERLAS